MTEPFFAAVRGLLLDLDGVLYVGDRVITGAVETVRYLKSRRIPLRFVTNTTTKSSTSIHRDLITKGFPISRDEIISAPHAAVLYLRERVGAKCYFLLPEDTLQDFREFAVSDIRPDIVVIGDLGAGWSYEILNKVFRMVMEGADLVALHKGRYWEVEDGLKMDIGAFVAGLEYVTGKQATVVGRPAQSFFELALRELGLVAQNVAMVGDDIQNDIAGAQQAGLKGVLVKTGKYREELFRRSQVIPDAVLESITELMEKI